MPELEGDTHPKQDCDSVETISIVFSPRWGFLYLSCMKSLSLNPYFTCIVDLHMKESFWIFSFSADHQYSLYPKNSHLKELPTHSSLCPLAESGISENFASQLKSLWWFLCYVETKVLCYCVKGRLCVCYHFVLGLLSPVLFQVIISFPKMYLPPPNLVFLFHHWICGLPFSFSSVHLHISANISCVSGTVQGARATQDKMWSLPLSSSQSCGETDINNLFSL